MAEIEGRNECSTLKNVEKNVIVVGVKIFENGFDIYRVKKEGKN